MITDYQIVYEGDDYYHHRQLMYMKNLVEFVVCSLNIEDGSQWRDDRNFSTNQEILEVIQTYRFVPCRVIQDGEGEDVYFNKITVVKGEEVECVKMGECKVIEEEKQQ